MVIYIPNERYIVTLRLGGKGNNFLPTFHYQTLKKCRIKSLFSDFCVYICKQQNNNIMPFFILKTLLICTFLLTWAVLGLASISLIWRNKHKKDLAILLAPILLIYWGLTSYSTLYENFFLLQRTSLLLFSLLYSISLSASVLPEYFPKSHNGGNICYLRWSYRVVTY